MKIFSLSIIILAVVACGKKTTVIGKVINPVTGMGIEGATVVLQQSGKGLPAGIEDVESVISDANGNFNISAKKVKPLTCAVALDSYKYYHLGWSVDNNSNFTLSLKKGKTTNANYYAVPYGCSSWHIKNVNCESGTDTMWYKIKYQFDEDFLNLWSLPITGCADITSNGCDKLEMGNHILYIRVKRPSGELYYYDTLFINETGTTYFDFNY